MELRQAAHEILEEVTQTLSQLSFAKVQRLAEQVKGRRLFVAGVGRSGFVIRCFAQRLMQLGIEAFVVGETTTPRTSKDDFVVIASGSGETSSMVALARNAKAIGCSIGILTGQEESTLAGLGDSVVIIPAPSPKLGAAKTTPISVQPGASLFEQCLLVTLDALILTMIDTSNPSAIILDRHANLE